MVGLDVIWSAWRNEYVTSADAAADPDDTDGCVFCRILNSGLSDDEAFIVWRGEETFCILNAFPYTSGHAMVMPYRHVGDLSQLGKTEHDELWDAATALVGALQTAYEPQGVNLGANFGRVAGAGVPGHVHLHALPRWGADTNFMTTIAAARVIPESLEDSYQKLRKAWPT